MPRKFLNYLIFKYLILKKSTPKQLASGGWFGVFVGIFSQIRIFLLFFCFLLCSTFCFAENPSDSEVSSPSPLLSTEYQSVKESKKLKGYIVDLRKLHRRSEENIRRIEMLEQQNVLEDHKRLSEEAREHFDKANELFEAAKEEWRKTIELSDPLSNKPKENADTSTQKEQSHLKVDEFLEDETRKEIEAAQAKREDRKEIELEARKKEEKEKVRQERCRLNVLRKKPV